MNIYACTSLWILSALLVLCVLGVLSRSFEDNWLQHIGLISISGWCVIRLTAIVNGYIPEPISVLVYFGMLSYAIGTLLKVLRHRRETRDRSKKGSPSFGG